ncbi:MAG: enoyl-CoA hydratase-related protein [Sphingobium sp.]
MSDSVTQEPPVLCEMHGAVARITLNRPAAGNSLSFGLMQALRAALAELREDCAIKVIVIQGSGGRIFCAGHDLRELAGEEDTEALARDFEMLGGLMQDIMGQPQIMIAKVEGVATAAGCELVAACDLALASVDARFAVPGVNIGFWCYSPQIQLSRAIGRKQAMMMLATGKLFPAEHAKAIGLINDMYPPEALDAAVEALAQAISTKSRRILARGKAAYQKQAGMSVPDAYRQAQADAISNLDLADAKEGISAFLEKRVPQWPGEDSRDR